MAVWERARAVSLVVYCHGHGVKDDGQAVPFLRCFNQRRGQVVELHGVRSQVVGLSVEFLRRHADEALVDAVVAEVAGNFLNPEEVWLRLQDAVHLAPEVALGAVNRWGEAVQKGLEAVDNSLVVNEDVHWPFGGGHEVKDGKRFGTLGILGKPVHARRVVEPMLAAIVDAKGGAGEEGDGLVRTRPVGAGVDPATARVGSV